MSSTRTAYLILFAVWLVATLLVTAAHLRVLRGREPRRFRYAIAWFVCTAVLGALLSAVDGATGRIDFARRVQDFVGAGVMCGAALAAGAWWIARDRGPDRRAAGFVKLLLAHGAAILVTGYFFV